MEIQGLPQGNAARTVEAWIKTTGSGPQRSQSFFSYGERDGDSKGFTLMTTHAVPEEREAGSWGTDYSKPFFVAWANDFVVDTNNAELNLDTFTSNLTKEEILVSDGKWHKITVTFDGDILSMYLDNRKIYASTQSNYGRDFGDTLATQGTTLYLGGAMPEDWAYGFYGEIKQVAVWDVALTQDQLTPMSKNRDKAPPIPLNKMPLYERLVAYFPLNSDGADLVSGEKLNLFGEAAFDSLVLEYLNGGDAVLIEWGARNGMGDDLETDDQLSANDTQKKSMLGGLGGNDSLVGSKKNDLLLGGWGSDSISGGEGFDFVACFDVKESVNISLRDKKIVSNSGTDDISSIEGAIGSIEDDTIEGDDAANVLYGLSGDDEITASDGNDTVYAGGGDDVIVGGDGKGDDKYYGGEGIDTIKYLSAKWGISVDLEKGTSASLVKLTDRKNKDASETGKDKLFDIENITAGNHSDVLLGNKAANVIGGEDGHDKIYGKEGDDSLIGGGGNDTLFGGLGNDSLTGDSGNDRFAFDTKLNANIANVDVVTDFGDGEDKIALAKSIFKLPKGVVNKDGTLNSTATVNNYLIISGSDKNWSVSYDADGVGNKSQAIKFVDVTLVGQGNALTIADFVMF
jgi:Ca2+-binding RTX toxin-like protein